jgi:hypothetical protein
MAQPPLLVPEMLPLAIMPDPLRMILAVTLG